MNILITSVSRKVWLVKALKEALVQEGLEGNIVSVDFDPLSAGLYFSDSFYTVPKSDDEKFIPTVLGICKKEKIKLLIPTRDAELLSFAQSRDKFKKHGIEVMISSPEVIETCQDKYRFFQFLKNNDFPTPWTSLPDQISEATLSFPLLIKSRSGSGGRGLFFAKDKNELDFFRRYIKDSVIQEVIHGQEYTVDVFADFKGKVISIVVRQRIEVINGESYKGKTVKDNEIMNLTIALTEKLGVVGHITVQCIKSTRGIRFIEINPRFGGGSHLGFHAGVSTPQFLVRLVAQREIEPQIGNYKEQCVMLRYTEDYFIEP